MAVVVGDGSHSADIQSTLDDWRVCRHSSRYRFDPRTIIAINDPQLRAKVADALGITDEQWVHPTAYIGPGCVIRSGTHINYMASMTRTTIGIHTTISPGVTICGDVKIGDRVLIGAGAVICDRVTIGSDVTIGAGCIVLPESVIPNGTTWVGNPARQIK